MPDFELLLAVSRLSFLTCREKQILANKLDNLKELTVSSIEDICQIIGRSVKIRSWNPDLLEQLAEKALDQMERHQISCVAIHSADYPPLLREMFDPPFLIFWRGMLPNPERPLVAMVGTRAPSGDGVLGAVRIAQEFGDAGVSVISGLARGIDAFAHKGNISGGAPTVAVLACGPDMIYPRSNARLAGRLLETGGCIISEYQPGETPLKYRFPERNRIISGLARSVLVVEAPEKSGALITADFALEQGKDLFVYRKTLESKRGAGTRNLHVQGAYAVDSAQEIIESWASGPFAGSQLSFEFKNDTGARNSCAT